ncbi:MAG: UDP-3-O-(3-hydroxymyristoyl)glucosamine N-acyltransferase [Gammaproteobacteria bacterium]|nr:UDP-3-O-(3-hydroxymyristoyl)glucosamine N-acyltransferase [Gammaproteobacteria bacterium]
MVTHSKSYTLGEIASILKLKLLGDEQCVVNGLSPLKSAVSGQLSFFNNPAYINQLRECNASAVIVDEKYADACKNNVLISSAPYVSFAEVTVLFDKPTVRKPSVHPSAHVHESVALPESVYIGPNVVLDASVELGKNCVIGSGTFLGEGVKLGNDCLIHSNVSIYHDVSIGNNAIIHSGSVVGADGFGFAFDGEKSVKIHQLGSVLIGNDVEIGSCSTIDRGTLENTIIGNGVKIDNQVQIGHNCAIGDHSIICGCTGISGSVTIGRYCVMGGASGTVGHITITDKVQVSAMSLVSESITEAGTYSSGTWTMKTSQWKRNNIRFQQLDSIAKRVKQLEKMNNKS